MSYNYFKEKIDCEKKYMPLVISLFENLGYVLLADVREKSEYQKVDIDLLFRDNVLGEVPVEVKIRLKDYNDLIVETYSCFERKTLGNLYVSQAFFYAYIIIEDSKLKKAYIIHMPSLRTWFDKSKQKYKPRYAPNPPDQPVYNTEFYPIPLADIPNYIFYVKTTEEEL